MPRVPVIQQMSAVECGPSCLAMVLSGLGRASRVRDVREAFAAGRDGTTGRRIVEVARDHGLLARGAHVDERGLRTVRLPAIAHWDRSHFIVVEKVTAKQVRIVDPANGRRQMGWDEFFAHFTGVILEFELGPGFERRRTQLRDGVAFRFIRDVVRMTPKWIALALALSGLVQLLGLGSAWTSKYAIDSVIATRTGTLGVLFTAVVGYVVVQALTNLGRSLVLLVLQQQLDRQLSTRFMAHLLRLPFRYFQSRNSGDLLTRLASNTIVRELLTSQMVTLAVDTLFVVVYTVILISISPSYAAIVAILAIAQAIIIVGTLRPVHELAQRELAAESESQSVAVDSLQGIEFIKSSGLSLAVLNRWTAQLDKYLAAAFRRRRFDTFNESVVGLFQAAAPLLLLVVGTWQVQSGQMTVGAMVALGAVATSLLRPVSQLIASLRYLQTLGSHVERIHDVLDEPIERSATGAIRADRISGDIALESVSFRYAPDAPAVLRDVSLRAPHGSKIAIVGATGSGKTTLVRLLTGLLQPTEGTVLIDGRTIDDYDTEYLRRRFGLVTQTPHAFGASIRQNLCLGVADASDEQLIATLRQARFLDDIERMPLGLDTVIGEGGSTLSGGQRQRLAIARALLMRPAVLVLDEATSHLDAITESEISEELASLGCTRIVIAHRISTVIDADEILVLAQGTIVERGTHNELLANGGRYATLVNRQIPTTALQGA